MKIPFLEFLQNLGDPKEEKKFNGPDDVDREYELPNSEDAEIPVLPTNMVYYTIDLNQEFKNIKHLIRAYREVATNHEIEDAIDEIVNEAVVVEDNKNNININLDEVEGISDGTKKKIQDEFKEILRILNFKRNGSFYFRNWYIDGRLWFQLLYRKNINNGIAEVNLLSPLDITRAKDEDGNIFYVYKEDETNKAKRENNFEIYKNRQFDMGLKISESNIIFVPSNLLDPESKYYISHLQKSIKPLNQLKLLEDSAVIYRITRAPERRVFYIDVGKLPKTKAEEYVKGLMNKFKTKISYDVTTGKVTQNKKVMTMLEDFYLPSRGDSKGTKVDTLEGGQQLGEIEDILYFRKKLLKSLKVPFTRLETEEPAIFNLGSSGELTRPELKFQKFIGRLRGDFSILFHSLLKIQLVTKRIITIKDWNKINNDIDYIWPSDSYFTELKNSEILTQRLELLDSINDHIGKYFSSDWVKKNVLHQTEEEIENMQKEIEEAGDGEQESEEAGDGEQESKEAGF